MPCRIYKLDFQEKNLNLDRDLNHGSPVHWSGNLDSSMVKSARIVIWRPVVQIPVQVQIFLLKILFINFISITCILLALSQRVVYKRWKGIRRNYNHGTETTRLSSAVLFKCFTIFPETSSLIIRKDHHFVIFVTCIARNLPFPTFY